MILKIILALLIYDVAKFIIGAIGNVIMRRYGWRVDGDRVYNEQTGEEL